MKDVMLNALELLYYAGRFRGQRIVLVIEPGQNFLELLLDIRLLQSAGIQVVVVVGYSPGVEQTIRQLRDMGTRLVYAGGERTIQSYIDLKNTHFGAPGKYRIDTLLSSGVVTILEIKSAKFLEDLIRDEVFILANKLQASKVLVLGRNFGNRLLGQQVSHLSGSDLTKMIEAERTPLESRSTLSLMARHLTPKLDVSLIENEPGTVFKELFTHSGSGTLISCSYETTLRSAALSDVQQIYFLMKPSMDDGSILALSEESIASDISTYYVFTVNGEIVASAKLTRYGNSAELAKFSTLPRYRGGGKANRIAQQLIERARNEGLHSVFALSTKPKVWDFFERLGFYHIPRTELPEEWQDNYDFTRPSRAMALHLVEQHETRRSIQPHFL